MENTVEEYRKQFQPETVELIVRIRWCWEKGHANFKMFGNYYKAEAQFDKALDVKSGQVIGAEELGFFHKIEWLSPKKLFGFKYSYKFEKGNLYRILVRESIPKGDEKFKKYYLEQVLEKDVKEPRLDSRYIFESKFEEKESDLIVLVQQRIYGWRIDLNYRIPKAAFIASIDCMTNELNQAYGTLTWIEKESGSKIKYNFDDLGTYLVRVRKSKENNNSYMLLNVMKKVTDSRLEQFKEEYLKPIVIKNEIGEFKLDKNYDWFEGKIDYLDETCAVRLGVKKGETTADQQFDKLSEIMKDLAGWDNKVKKYASQELCGLANDWCEEEREITEEEFNQRIYVYEIFIHPGGAVEVMLGDDDMFADHDIVIDIDENGSFVRADIEG